MAGASAELIQALFQLVILSLMLERGLSFVFEIRLAPPRGFSPGKRTKADEKTYPMIAEVLGAGLKALITYVVSAGLCFAFGFDVFKFIFTDGKTLGPVLDIFLTAAVVAGGSAGAIKLFQDVLGLSKTARDAAREAKEEEAKARLAKAASDRAASEFALEQTKRLRERTKEADQAALAGRFPAGKSAPASLAASQPWTLRPPPSQPDVEDLPVDIGII
jgi:hypothetical protein